MKRPVLVVVALALVTTGTASAQLSKLKRKAEQALGAAAQEQAGDPAAAPAGESRAGARPAARVDADRKYPPGMSYSTVLNGIDLLANGKLNLDNMQATFLPDGVPEVVTVVRRADGEELYELRWDVQVVKKPYALLTQRGKTDLRTGQSIPGAIPFGEPGDYVLDFYLPDEHFYTAPFSVVRLGSGDDPFGAGECYAVDGPWRDWGYLYYRDAMPDQNLQWKIWLHSTGCEPVPIDVGIEVRRGGEIVCEGRELVTYTVQPKWERVEIDMVFPRGKEVPFGTYFKAQDLLGTDGTYTLAMTIDGAPYGTWTFDVAGGQFQPRGRTLRGAGDPLTFVEGGRDAFWYGRVK